MKNYNPDDQRIFIDGLINARDLGGMPLSDGKFFVKDYIIRSGSPSIAPMSAHDELIRLGVTTVIDLRAEAELLHYGNPFKDDGVTSFHNISLFLGDPDSDEDPTMEFLRTHTLGDFYVMMCEELGERIVNVLRVIYNTNGKVLFHCAHGKDRTGVIAAILYLIAGASKENIILNYKVSFEYAKSFLEPLIEARVENMRHTLRSDAHNMETFLKHIDEAYEGNIRNYLNKYGMSDEEIDSLKARITE